MPRGQVFRSPTSSRATSRRDNAITAAARNLSAGQSARQVRKTSNLGWQRILWGMYDTVPEFRFAVNWVGNTLSKAKLEIRKDGELVTDQAILDILASFFGGPSGQTEMFRKFGIHFTVAGEAWVIGRPGRDEDQWDVVASTEVTVQEYAGKVREIKVEGILVDEDQNTVVRTWKSHPEKSYEPDCPARPLIPVLRELTGLTEHVAAQIDSRLASAGILLVPSEMELPSITLTEVVMDDDGGALEQTVQLDNANALTQRLIDIASRAIGDRSSAAALVPLVIAAPGEFLEKVQHITFWSGLDEKAKELRDEAVRRIATGMDMPPEVVLGTADVNHWGAWQIEEAAIKAHTEPLLAIVLQALTTGYLRPLLEEWGYDDAESYTFTADTAEMRLRPNRSKEAMELYDRGQVNGETLRRENGFEELDSMDAQEKQLWLLQKIASGQTQPEQVVAALRMLGLAFPAPVAEPQRAIETQEARPTPSLKEHPRRAEPDPAESESDDARAVAASAVRPMEPNPLVMASEQMVKRALQRVGNRLKVKASRAGFDLPAGTKAQYIYLTVGVKAPEVDAAMADAWDLDDFEYPGVENAVLERCLAVYTRDLLLSQRPHSRSALAEHLLLSMSEGAAA